MKDTYKKPTMEIMNIDVEWSLNNEHSNAAGCNEFDAGDAYICS